MTDPQVIVNLGTGGSDLNGQNGSTTSADSNDARLLVWPGDNAGNYVYLPGVSPNRLTLPDSPAVSVTGDLEIIVHAAFDDWSLGNKVILDRNNGTVVPYRLLLGGGQPWFRFLNGGTFESHLCSTAVSFADGEAGWIKVTLDVDNGAGAYEVKFYTSSDGNSWSQLGSTVTGGSTTTVNTTSVEMTIGSQRGGPLPATMKVYRLMVKDGIDGTTVLDVDTSLIGSGSATSFAATTGQTVTINRSTSGRKSVAVVERVWLFGTDDYMEVTDNALLDFDASESLTVVAAHRVWNTQGTNDTLVAKKDNTTNTTQGWSVSGGSSTALAVQSQIGDGAAGITATSSNRVAGELTITAAVRDSAADTLTVYRNDTPGSAVTDTTTGSLSNSEAIRIARLSGAGAEYSDMELVGIAVFRRALSASEVAQVTAYYQARLS